jgi:hypothetical protein
MVFMLTTVGLIQSRVYSMRGVPPYGVPTIVNQMFWGGLWGLLFAALADMLSPWPLLLLGFLFGVLGPVLVRWFVVTPLKGTPIAAGWGSQRILATLLLNGFWGIGVALTLPIACPAALPQAVAPVQPQPCAVWGRGRRAWPVGWRKKGF